MKAADVSVPAWSIKKPQPEGYGLNGRYRYVPHNPYGTGKVSS